MEVSQSDDYICPVCGKDGRDMRGLVLHMQVITTDGRWPCLRYSKFETIEDFKKDVTARIRRRASKSAAEELSIDRVMESFQAKVKYGPMFACASCHTHHQYSNVSRIETIPLLGTRQGREKFLESHLPPHLFVQLDNMWICRPCKLSISSNTVPALASVNNMHGTWGPSSSEYTQEEVDLVALTHVFHVIHSLHQGVARLGTTTSLDLYVPLPEVVDAEAVYEAERPPEEVLLQLHLRPPGERPEVDGTRFRQGVCALLENNHRYRPRRDDVKQDVLDFWDDTLKELPHIKEEEETQEEGKEDLQEESHFTRMGPTVNTIHSVVLPNSVKELSKGGRTIAQIKNLDVKIGGALDDPEEKSSMEFEREVEVSVGRWAQQRMSHVSRAGPCCRPGFVFGLLLKETITKLTSSRLLPKQNDPTDNDEDDESFDKNWVEEDVLLDAEEQKIYHLAMIPGTDRYLDLKREELEAQMLWYGPPTVFVTLTLRATTEDIIACFTSHSRREGEDFQVWHESDEETMLQLRPGKTVPNRTRGGRYFVHTKSITMYGDCPYHLNCRRDTLEEARVRY